MNIPALIYQGLMCCGGFVWSQEKVRWRLGSESNRRKRCCRPLHDHSATQPHGADDSLVEFELHLLT